MRKLGVLLSCFILLSAFTCETEPVDGGLLNSEDPNAIGIVGEWEAVEFRLDMDINMSVAGVDTVIESESTGTNLNYNVTFTDTNYSVSGDYGIVSNVTINNVPSGADTSSYTDVTGSGTYSLNGGEITVDGSFFELNLDGVDTSVIQGEQTANYTITDNGNTLTFTQNQTQTDNSSGVDVTIKMIAKSVWTRVQ